ncbi:EAL domain-containing protein [Dyella halodurans]|uniref:cyclic-guanylate-specific phosphodiesterase n=1 Tax=Dyella halodurans TaxID=1920171 RepID=A0ABV9C1X8_9GAMM|nr:EAL domain-containing protein [Dyella halodurans]
MHPLGHYVRAFNRGPIGRIKAFVSSALIGTLVIALLAGVAFHYASNQIWNAAFGKLNAVGVEVLERSERSSDQIRAAIRDVQTQGALPCSPENLALMAQTNLKYGQLQGVGYVANGRLMCSSYGSHGAGIPLPPPRYQGTSGNLMMLRDVNLSLASSIEPQPVTIITAAGNGYSAILSPTLPIDVFINDRDMAVGTVIYSSNEIKAARGGVDPTWRTRLGDSKHTQFVQNHRIVSLWRSPRYDYFAFAAIPDDEVRARIRYAGLLILSCAAFAMAVLLLAAARSALRRVPLSESIRDALWRREFHLVYQPVVELKTGRWVGAEALLRWRRSTGEQVRPDVFISVAEESGVIEEITDHVFELVTADMAGFFESHPHFHVAINVSSIEIQSPDVVSRLTKFCAGVTGANARNFVIEATERSLIDPEKARNIMEEIRKLGFAVAIDDFGTGYSSLCYLQTLSTDYLKIDKSFIDAIDTESVKNDVVLHIIALAKDLQLRLIAEGVENAAQATYLRDRGVEYAQGWHFAKPMTCRELLSSLGRQTAESIGGPNPSRQP